MHSFVGEIHFLVAGAFLPFFAVVFLGRALLFVVVSTVAICILKKAQITHLSGTEVEMEVHQTLRDQMCITGTFNYQMTILVPEQLFSSQS